MELQVQGENVAPAQDLIETAAEEVPLADQQPHQPHLPRFHEVRSSSWPQLPQQPQKALQEDASTQTVQRSKTDRLKDSLKKKFNTLMEIPCINVSVRLIKLLISMWALGDMISDGFGTRKFYELASVSNDIEQK